jgi:pimeloyl-ACP methyl ester carboxylesterase
MPCHFLLLPGFDGTGEQFAPLVDALGPSHAFTLVRYANERSLERCVDAAASLLPDEPVVLIAESFSGPMAIALMARFPDRFQCAVLCATFAVSPFRSLLPAALKFSNYLFARNPLKPLLLRTFCVNGVRDQKVIELTTRVASAMDAEIIKSRLQVLLDLDVSNQLKSITVPTLYLRASQDRIVSRRLGQNLIEGLKDIEVQEIDGPHLLLQAKPVECAAAISAFVSS